MAVETGDSALLRAIRERRSVRRYRAEPVPQPVLEQVLTAAAWAPSAHNRQPWRFAVVRDPARRERLARRMGDRLRADLLADGAAEDVIDADVSRSYARITAAPALVVVCLSLVDMDAYPDATRSRNEFLMAVQSTAMAGQNLLLAAHDAGLGACWLCAPLFCPDVVVQVLDLPDDWQPQGMITLGYPAQARTKTRNAIEECTLWR